MLWLHIISFIKQRVQEDNVTFLQLGRNDNITSLLKIKELNWIFNNGEIK